MVTCRTCANGGAGAIGAGTNGGAGAIGAGVGVNGGAGTIGAGTGVNGTGESEMGIDVLPINRLYWRNGRGVYSK
tara:strand:+ start:5708 stop:5932 length:225 start_codon:yes stop_codon:yes gene_type:complete